MLDKRKLVQVSLVGVVLLAALAAAIYWLASSADHHDSKAPRHSATTATATSSTPTPTAAGDTPGGPGYDGIEAAQGTNSKIAAQVATAAATWDGTETTDARRQALVNAGADPQLAAAFAPVWAEVFNKPSINVISNSADGRRIINASAYAAGGTASVSSITGAKPNRRFHFGVLISYTLNWETTDGKSHGDQSSATWYVTVDEATHKVVAIDQPSQTDLSTRINK